jgi:hypothetical protein
MFRQKGIFNWAEEREAKPFSGCGQHKGCGMGDFSPSSIYVKNVPGKKII